MKAAASTASMEATAATAVASASATATLRHGGRSGEQQHPADGYEYLGKPFHDTSFHGGPATEMWWRRGN